MDRFDIAELGIKLLAVFTLLSLQSVIPLALSFITTLMEYSRTGTSALPLMLFYGLQTIASVVIPLAVEVILWRHAGQLALKFWSSPQDDFAEEDSAEMDTEGEANPSTEDTDVETVPLTIKVVQRAVFAALGLFLLVEAIPDILWTIVGLFQPWVSPIGLQEPDGRSWGRLIGFGVQVIVGLWLLNNPEGITTLIERIRHPRPPWYEDPKEFEEDRLARGE